MSPNTIVRLKQQVGVGVPGVAQQDAWTSDRYAYIWADGVYLGAGVHKEKTALLCVVGAREDGVKELLGMELGYRESTENWSGVLRSLKGSKSDVATAIWRLVMALLGLWAALDEVFPTAGHQRCWNHRTLNVQSRSCRRR